MAERPGLRLGILGPVELRGPAGPVPLPARTERAVIAALAAREGRPVTAAALADDVWGEEGDARRKLVVAVSRLRNRLGGALGEEGRGLIETVADGYRLAVEVIEVDATRLTTLTREGQRLLEDGSPAEARHRLEEGLRLWRADALPELASSTTGQLAAARLTELRQAALDASSDAALALGDNESVIRRLEALLVHDPYRERRWAQLMVALYRAGRQAEALRAYQRVHSVLSLELGIEPGPELRRLESAILAHEPSLDLDGVRTGAGGSDQLLPTPKASVNAVTQALWVRQQREIPLVGRTHEVAVLLGDWRRIKEVGTGGVVFIEGDTDVGKTRLAAEVGQQVLDFGGRMVVATCTPRAGLMGLLPSVTALGLELPDVTAGSPELMSFGLGVAKHVVQGADQPDTLLVLDDAHLADEQTVALFTRMGEQPLPLPQVNTVLALVLVQRGFERPAGAAALVRNIERLPVHRHLVLERLDADQTRELAELMVGPDGPAGLAEQIAAAGAGNPSCGRGAGPRRRLPTAGRRPAGRAPIPAGGVPRASGAARRRRQRPGADGRGRGADLHGGRPDHRHRPRRGTGAARPRARLVRPPPRGGSNRAGALPLLPPHRAPPRPRPHLVRPAVPHRGTTPSNLSAARSRQDAIDG